MKVKELIRELEEYNMDADITTSISEDIGIAYVCSDGINPFTKKTTPQLFIEPMDSCPICPHNYMDDATETRWCSIYDKPCGEVEECYEWESDDVLASEYVEDCYEGWIVKSRANCCK